MRKEIEKRINEIERILPKLIENGKIIPSKIESLEWELKYLKLTQSLTEQEQPKQSLDNAVDEAVNSMEFKGMLEQVYSLEQPKQSVVRDEDVCEMYSSFYGERIDNLQQLVKTTFNGEDLKEFIQHCVNKLNKSE